MKFDYLIPTLIFLLLVLGCQPSQIVLEDRQPTPEPVSEATPVTPVDDFDERLKSVQLGDFYFVYAFRRKDGEIFNADDIKFLKENTSQANQGQLTSDKKAAIIGTNYLIPPENLDALKKRFKIDDYSPKDVPKKEQNSNMNR